MTDFGDIEDLDAVTAGDETIDWSQIDELARRFDHVMAIQDDKERLAAVEALVAELGA
jgi:hypothetical protein